MVVSLCQPSPFAYLIDVSESFRVFTGSIALCYY